MPRLQKFVFAAALLSGACENHGRAKVPYMPVEQVEAMYGPLIGAANHPTPDQHGTGERIGLFRDASNTVWGLPLAIEGDSILACAPGGLRDASITDAVAAGSALIGAANAPTGWRGGTGDLELLLRDPAGRIHVQTVHGGELPSGPVCSAPDLPGPPQTLRYYRMAATANGER